jgi:predicted P-loop ATPase
VFVGTTNEDDYLRDHTGGRRFLPVRCHEVDVAGVSRQRDLLWAEAMALYLAGHPYWRLPDEAAAEQDKRYQEDSWTDPIREWVEGRAPPAAYPPDTRIGRLTRASVTEVMVRALGVEMAKHTRQDQMRVGVVLRRLGFQRVQVRSDAGRRWVYERGPP